MTGVEVLMRVHTSDGRQWLHRFQSGRNDTFVIGSAANANLVIARPGVARIHCTLRRRDDAVWLTLAQPGLNLVVNRTPVHDTTRLEPISVLEIGDVFVSVFILEQRTGRHDRQRSPARDNAVCVHRVKAVTAEPSNHWRRRGTPPHNTSDCQTILSHQTQTVVGDCTLIDPIEVPSECDNVESSPSHRPQIIGGAPVAAPPPPSRTRISARRKTPRVLTWLLVFATLSACAFAATASYVKVVDPQKLGIPRIIKRTASAKATPLSQAGNEHRPVRRATAKSSKTPLNSTPERTAPEPNVSSKASPAPAEADGGITDERATEAARHLVAGRRRKAAEVYAQLAKAHPEVPAFAVAERVLAKKLGLHEKKDEKP